MLTHLTKNEISAVFEKILSKYFSRMIIKWLRRYMEIFFALLAICAGNSPVTGEFPVQKPVTRKCDIFFDLSLNKQLS